MALEVFVEHSKEMDASLVLVLFQQQLPKAAVEQAALIKQHLAEVPHNLTNQAVETQRRHHMDHLGLG